MPHRGATGAYKILMVGHARDKCNSAPCMGLRIFTRKCFKNLQKSTDEVIRKGLFNKYDGRLK